MNQVFKPYQRHFHKSSGMAPVLKMPAGTVAWFSALCFLFMLSCQKPSQEALTDEISSDRYNNPGQGHGTVSSAMVLTWNQAAIQVVLQTQALVPGPPITPFVESRFYAMVNLAMHDALNSIVPRYETYALTGMREKDADPDAAVAQAAHDVITAAFGTLNPPASVTPQPVRDYIDNLLQQSLALAVEPESLSKGVELGKAAAAAILAKRQGDGSDNVMFPVAEGTLPGEYRFTFPFNGPPFNTPPFSGLYDAPGWGDVTPFGMESGSQFRPGPPDPVTSAAYTADFNEIKRLGGFNSVERSPEQTNIAKFWAESSPQGWNRIAVNVINAKGIGAWKAAKLLALLQMAEADAYIGSIEAKLHYFFWRPVTAVRMADTDGNPDTHADPEWEVLGWNPAGPPDLRYWPTPPVADYPSAHATAGGAGAEVLKLFFGTDRVSFSSASTSHASTRQFSSFSEAARENALSRIYIGFHFRKASLEGENHGRNIGRWIYEHHLR